MSALIEDVINKTKNLTVPIMGNQLLQVGLGIMNCFLFGIGMMVAGILNNSLPDIVIGLLQLVIPVVGWIWAVVWGILMVSKYKQAA